MLNSGYGYIAIGVQAVRGTPVTPSLYVPILSDGASVSYSDTVLMEGGDNQYNREGIKISHRENFSFDLNARPSITAKLTGWLMGEASIVGAGDPYTHTLIRGERPYLTIDRKLPDGTVQRMYDAKISGLDITGNAGQPIRIAVTGAACKAVLRTTSYTAAYDTEKPFMFYHGAGRFKYDTTADELINSFSIGLKVGSLELTDDAFSAVSIDDMNYGVEMSTEIFIDNLTRWKAINYGGTSSAVETIKTGAFELDLRYTKSVADDRQLKITIPKFLYRPTAGENLSPAPNTLKISVAGIGLKQSTTELCTVVCKNAISTTII